MKAGGIEPIRMRAEQLQSCADEEVQQRRGGVVVPDGFEQAIEQQARVDVLHAGRDIGVVEADAEQRVQRGRAEEQRDADEPVAAIQRRRESQMTCLA